MSIALSSPSTNTGKILVNGSDRLLINADTTLSAVATPAQFDNTTKLSTTAFVQRAAGSYSGVTALTASITLTAFHVGRFISVNTLAVSGQVVVLPQTSEVADGSLISIANNGTTNSILISRNNTDTLYLGSVTAISLTLNPGESVDFVSIASGGFWVMCGGSLFSSTSGKTLQTLHTSTGAFTTYNSVPILPVDNTIPQNTEGSEIFTLAITPKSANSTIVVEATVNLGGTSYAGGGNYAGAIFVDSTANAIAADSKFVGAGTGQYQTLRMNVSYTNSSLTSKTFRVRIGGDAIMAFYLNGANAAGKFGGTWVSSLKLTEIAN